MKHLTAVALVLWVTACTSSAPKPDTNLASAAPAGPIALNFDWPAGLRGTMQLDGVTEKDGNRSEVHATYRLSTQTTGEEVALSHEAQKLDLPDVPEEQRKMVEPMFQAVPGVLFRGGDVVGIQNFEEFARLMREMLAPAFKEMPALEAQTSAMLTEEFFLASAQEEWEWRATSWHGLSLEVGESVEEEVELSLMFVPETAKGRMVMTLEEVLPCPGATARQCVRLRRTLSVDPEGLQKALGKLAQVFDSVEIERSIDVEVIAEPATLLTHRFTKLEKTLFRAKRGDKETKAAQSKETREAYTWE